MTFDSRWKDLPDYIIGITKEIWEDRGIARLHDYYAPDIVVRTPASVVVGNETVIAATMATLAEFPDRTLLGEDVIWSQDEDGRGQLSSHRLLSMAMHLGDGVYGRATGKALRYRILADCHVTGTVIDDEWLVRDQGAIVRQLGWTPEAYAADLIDKEGGPERCVRPLTPDIDQDGPYAGTGNADPWGEKLSEVLRRIMAADLRVIPEAYDRACQGEYPGGHTAHGIQAVDRFWMQLRAAFPHAIFTIHHVIGRDDDLMPPRAAVRWSLWGRHEGWGGFGTPSGATVHVMGITHVEFGRFGPGGWSIRREWTLYDEMAIWKQIHLGAA